MSSRQEQKERRRQERIAAERAAARAAARSRRLRIAGGAALVVVAVAAVVVVVSASGGGGGEGVDETQLAVDAKAAGCALRTYKDQGRDHTTQPVDDYDSNPPTSGPHNPVPAQDGFYAPGNEPAKENVVHSLEHGRVLLEYRPGTSGRDIAALRRIAEGKINGSAAYHVLLFENNTKMPSRFAAVAWTRLLACQRLTARSEEVIGRFRSAFTDKGPEFIP